MRYGLILSIFLLLGVGEYAFVEFYPLHSQQREAKFKKLPIVRNVVLHQEKNMVKDAFDHDDDGTLWLVSQTDSTSWSSVDALWSDYRAEDPWAMSMMSRLRTAESNREAMPSIRQKAIDGDTFARIWYYSIAGSSHDPLEKDRALRLLQEDTTATAAWYLAVWWAKPRIDLQSKEGILLTTRMNLENLHPDNVPERQRIIQEKKGREQMKSMLDAALQGKEDAQWVVDQLKSRHGIDLAEELSNQSV